MHHEATRAEGDSLCGQEGEIFSGKVLVTFGGPDIVEERRENEGKTTAWVCLKNEDIG